MSPVSVISFGCKVNQYDGEALRESLIRELPPESLKRDICVVNACAVTREATRQARQMVRRLARRRPKPFLVLFGCWPQAAAEEVLEIEGVDLVVGHAARARAVELICARRPGVHVEPFAPGTAIETSAISIFPDHTRAFVKVQDGCDRGCSYCIVPLARGPSRSRPMDEVVAEIRSFAEAGRKELVITGACLGDYRWKDRGLGDLIREIDAIPGEFRVRLSSLEPGDLTPGLLESIVSSRRICRHLHVPLQSGDDTVLAAMNRPYTAEMYADLIRRLEQLMGDVGLGADVMVGFPGESEEQFGSTFALVERLPLSYLHVFVFSPRPGTRAASLPGQVAPPMAKRRGARLRALGKQKAVQFARRHIGSVLEVLVESPRDRGRGTLGGVAQNYLRIVMRGEEEDIGRLVHVRAEGMEGERLIGRIVEADPGKKDHSASI